MNKNITLQTLTLINFKGIKSLTIEFQGKITNISGANRLGKTTIADAWNWLLFNKDSAGRADFNIKNIDAITMSAIPNLEHEVNASILFNGENIFLKKIYKEKWTKPRGQKDHVFSGHETLYFYSGVPCSQSEYQSKIASICDEKLFKLITSPGCFPGLPWLEQRNVLFTMAGEVRDEDIAKQKPEFIKLLSTLNNTKTIDEYKKQIASQKKKIKDELEMIPARIDEVQRGLPEVMDWIDIERQIANISLEITQVDEEIMSSSKGLEGEQLKRTDLQRKISGHITIKQQIDQEVFAFIDDLKFKYERDLRLKSNQKKDLEETIGQNRTRIQGLELSIESLKKERETKINQWHGINDEVLSFSQDSICPTCGQELPQNFLEDKKQKAEANFNDIKASRLKMNVSEGKAIKERISEFEEKINTCRKIIEESEVELKTLESEILTVPNYEEQKNTFLQNKRYNIVLETIKGLESEFNKLGPINVPDTSDLKLKRGELQNRRDLLRKDLEKKEQVNRGNNRTEELKKEQRELSQKLADQENVEFVIQDFEKAKINTIESQINKMFRMVKFRMFNKQINGGIENTCIAMIDGVPYPDLNNAARINAGLDVLSVLSKYHDVFAPVFIDNAESVNELLPIDSQLVRLVVTKDPKLIIN